LRALALIFGVFFSACGSSLLPEEDALPLGSVLQPAQGGGLDGGLGSSVATGTTCDKSSDFDPSCAFGPSGTTRDVVYSWTAPASDRYRFTTEGSDFDTVLELRSASSSSHVLMCNDDETIDTRHSALDVDLVRGQQVLVVVDSYGTGCGNYTLGISAQCGGCDTPPGSCHQTAGTCVNSACVYSLRPVGSACTDGNACTRGDTCNSSGVCTGTAVGCVHPIDTNEDGLATICLAGRDHGDCDYPVLDGLTVRMPLKGSFVFPFAVTEILSGTETYVKLIEQSGGSRQMTFSSNFAYWLKVNPYNSHEVLWDVPMGYGYFSGPLLEHHETVDMVISLQVKLRYPVGQRIVTAKGSPPNPLRLSYQ
jgi:hypothetical protein